MSKTSKIVTKTLAGVLSMAMVVTSLSITGTTADAKAKIKSVKVKSPVVNGGKLVLKKGQKKQIKVKVTKSGKISKKVTYKSCLLYTSGCFGRRRLANKLNIVSSAKSAVTIK